MGINLSSHERAALEELSEDIKTGRPRISQILDEEVDRSKKIKIKPKRQMELRRRLTSAFNLVIYATLKLNQDSDKSIHETSDLKCYPQCQQKRQCGKSFQGMEELSGSEQPDRRYIVILSDFKYESRMSVKAYVRNSKQS
ncbi:hypothetical protein H4Q26_012295 [Puccinia striiformis f. sp. tritici PST-130]|nr:hypothetical protein H4Q26_012295 [Puccinia striiformis f. sp. tritici PST-130]